jgi:hypothetical protein
VPQFVAECREVSARLIRAAQRTRHAAFRSLLGIAAAHQPLVYKLLISPKAKG